MPINSYTGTSCTPPDDADLFIMKQHLSTSYAPQGETGLSMQTRPLEEPVALAGFDADVHGVAVVVIALSYRSAKPVVATRFAGRVHFLSCSPAASAANSRCHMLRRSTTPMSERPRYS